jgi:hypothetical protein
MLVSLRPGTDREHLLRTLRENNLALTNLSNDHPGSAHAWLTNYIEWTSTAATQLSGLIKPKTSTSAPPAAQG